MRFLPLYIMCSSLSFALWLSATVHGIPVRISHPDISPHQDPIARRFYRNRDDCYSRLIFTLANNDEWRERLTRDGHFERSWVLGCYLAGIFACIKPSDKVLPEGQVKRGNALFGPGSYDATGVTVELHRIDFYMNAYSLSVVRTVTELPSIQTTYGPRNVTRTTFKEVCLALGVVVASALIIQRVNGSLCLTPGVVGGIIMINVNGVRSTLGVAGDTLGVVTASALYDPSD
ncbi:hypothetical protein BDR05DRAFT_1035361 [Suillus weaverae]|nr:hypothetical protein BDR05DRAFT_1035361 [Suillus weaverae]